MESSRHAPPALPDALAAPDEGPPRKATLRLLLSHPAHLIALGAGSGLSPVAPGTVGTLWGWFCFVLIQHGLGDGVHADVVWATILGLGWLLGLWACTHTARSLRVSDPGAVVWDEIWAIWLILWLVDAPDWRGQLVAFLVFRFFDAAKPGPVRWADQRFKRVPGQAIGWAQGWGIMFDDLVAALCTLVLLALAVALRQGGVSMGWLG